MEKEFTVSELLLIKEIVNKQVIYYNLAVKQKEKLSFNSRSEVAFKQILGKVDHLLLGCNDDNEYNIFTHQYMNRYEGHQ